MLLCHRRRSAPLQHGALADARSLLAPLSQGFGTDESTLIQVLTSLGPIELAAVGRTFEAQTGKALVKVLEKETGSWLLYALRALALGPLAFDAWLIHRACDGAGTHEECVLLSHFLASPPCFGLPADALSTSLLAAHRRSLLNEVLLGRTNNDIYLLKAAYKALYSRDLAAVVEGELSFKTKRLFSMALMGARDEAPFVDHQAVQADVRALQAAANGMGTDEIAICAVLVQRSPMHIAAVAQAFPQQHRRPLSQMIQSEFSGHMEGASGPSLLGCSVSSRR